MSKSKFPNTSFELEEGEEGLEVIVGVMDVMDLCEVVRTIFFSKIYDSSVKVRISLRVVSPDNEDALMKLDDPSYFILIMRFMSQNIDACIPYLAKWLMFSVQEYPETFLLIHDDNFGSNDKYHPGSIQDLKQRLSNSWRLSNQKQPVINPRSERRYQYDELK